MKSSIMASTLSIATMAFMAGAAKAADPTGLDGYSVSLFAAGPSGTSAADSVLVIGGHVYVGFGNGGAPTGGGTSNIVEYNSLGQMTGMTTVSGHNDGLRYDPATKQIWAIQNEDGPANLVLLNPSTLAAESSPISLAAVNGAGYDDMLYQGGKTFLSASNPSKNPNTDPAIVQVTVAGATATITPAFAGNATATPLDAGAPSTLNLTDPDSMSQTVGGRAVLDSQGDGQLVFISNLGKPGQSASVLQLADGVTVDDTAFGGSADMSLLVADKSTNDIWRVTGPFNPAWGFSAAQNAAGTAGFVGAFNATDDTTIGASGGVLTPIVTGLGNPGGEGFLAVPEPSTWAMMLVGFSALAFAARRRSRKAGAAAA